VPLSDLEKRMIYFAEGEDSSEGSSKWDDEFETNFHSAAYEPMVAKLLNHAYFRLKRGESRNSSSLGRVHFASGAGVITGSSFCGTKDFLQNVLPTMLGSFSVPRSW
jgi:curved DNA-binding protein CbpA